MTAVIIAFVVTGIVIVTILISVTIIAVIKIKPDFICRGMRIYVDKGIKDKVNQAQVSTILDIFKTEMSGPGLFNANLISNHFSDIRCYLRSKKIAGHEGYSYFNGVTNSEDEIEVACDSEFCGTDGRVKLHKTAFTYEIFNSCLWEFFGYEVATAEEFRSNDSESYKNSKAVRDKFIPAYNRLKASLVTLYG